MSVIKQLAGETAIYGLSNIISRVLQFVLLTPYLTRLFEEQSYYGIYTDLYAYAAFLLILFTYRLETGYFRFGIKSPEQEKDVFSTACLSHFATTVVLVSLILLARQPLANALGYPEQSHYIALFAGIIGLDAVVAIPFARLRLQNKALRFATIKLVAMLMNLILIFFFLEGCPWLIRQGYDFWSLIYDFDRRLDLIFLANLIASASIALYFMPQFFKVRLTFSSSLLSKILRYALPLTIVGLAGVFNQSSAVPLIKYLLGGSIAENLKIAGIYGGAAKLAILMNLFTVAFNYAAEPFFFKKAKDDDAREVYAEIAQAFALVASLGFLMIYLFLDVFQYFLGENYRSGVFVVVPQLLLGYWFLGLYYNIAVWYKINDRTRSGAIISICGSLIILPIAFIGIPIFGMVAMAVATMVCYMVMVLIGVLWGRRVYPVPYRWNKILSSLILAVLLGFGITTMVAEMDFVYQTLIKLLGITVYLFLIYRLDRKTIRTWIGIRNRI